MTTDLTGRPCGPLEETSVMKVTRIAMLIALLAASLTTTACQDTSLYTGVDANGGWNAPTNRAYGGGGITGYPF